LLLFTNEIKGANYNGFKPKLKLFKNTNEYNQSFIHLFRITTTLFLPKCTKRNNLWAQWKNIKMEMERTGGAGRVVIRE